MPLDMVCLTVQLIEFLTQVLRVDFTMDGAPMKTIPHSKASEGSSSQNWAHSPNNDLPEEGYSGDRVSSKLKGVHCKM